MFQLKDVTVQDILNINDLTLKSNIISIEGQSGSGKSTFLRLLNNLDDPTSGEIYFNDKSILEIPSLSLRKKVVMLPQNPVIFDGTIRDNLLIGLKWSNQKIAEDRELEKMLDLFLVDKSLDTKASDLSGGEKQRMSLGRILLMKESEAFLLDEPSSDLDDRTTNQVLEQFMKWTRHEGQQVIMVTHNKEVSREFADEIINMDEYSKQIQKVGD